MKKKSIPCFVNLTEIVLPQLDGNLISCLCFSKSFCWFKNLYTQNEVGDQPPLQDFWKPLEVYIGYFKKCVYAYYST